MIWTSNMFSKFVYRNGKDHNFMILLLIRVKLNEESQKSNPCKLMWKIFCVYRKQNTQCALPATRKYINFSSDSTCFNS